MWVRVPAAYKTRCTGASPHLNTWEEEDPKSKAIFDGIERSRSEWNGIVSKGGGGEGRKEQFPECVDPPLTPLHFPLLGPTRKVFGKPYKMS